MIRIALISTGGTIEKTYDELSGSLANQLSVLDLMLASLQLRNTEIHRVPLMNKDSMDMSDADHTLIAQTAIELAATHDGVIIVHGTDRLSVTGERIVELCDEPAAPIVLTGAIRPFEVRNTDALQNLTEALLAAGLLQPGIYVAMHNTVLAFPGVVKDTQLGTFVRVEGGTEPIPSHAIDERLVSVETHVTFQNDTVDALDTVVHELATRIEGLERTVARYTGEDDEG